MTSSVLTPTATATASATPAPQPAALRWQPRGTRSGVAVVDTVLDAFERRDGATINALLRPRQMPCSVDRTGIGKIACEDGVPDGTLVFVIPYISCEPNWFSAEQAVDAYGPPAAYPLLPGPFTGMLTVLALGPSAAPDRYAILDGNGGVVRLDDRGITSVQNGACIDSPRQVLDELTAKGATVLIPLRPPVVGSPPSYSRGTRTGIGIVDEVIESAEGRDVNRFLGLFQFTDLPCTEEYGWTQIDMVRCPNNTPPGTPTGAVAIGACTGVFYGVNQEQMDPNLVVRGTGAMGVGAPASLNTDVYAVVRGVVLPYDLPLPVESVIVFADGRLFATGDFGVTFFETGCNWTADDIVRDMERRNGNLDFLLPPR